MWIVVDEKSKPDGAVCRKPKGDEVGALEPTRLCRIQNAGVLVGYPSLIRVGAVQLGCLRGASRAFANASLSLLDW